MPVLYAPSSNPLSLTDEQYREIIASARRVAPEGRKIWFVLVRYNSDDGTRNRLVYGANVYFSPDQQSVRLRKGRCAYIDNERTVAMREQALAQLGGGTWPPVGAYVQVSAAAQPFGDDLGPPELQLAPFAPPEAMSDAELIGVVDCARAAYAENHIDSEQPIWRIERDAESFKVNLGWLVGPLFGRGETLTIQKTDGGYKAKECAGLWMS